MRARILSTAICFAVGSLLQKLSKLLYDILLLLALPWVWARLFVKARREPAYRERIGERFGFTPAGVSAGVIWFHTVSAGETNAAAPVIRAVKDRLPGETILVTTMTPSGSTRVRTLLGDIVEHCYVPFDYPWAVGRFLARVRPKALVLMETELWPNLVAQTAGGGAAVYLVNARLSARAHRGYRRIAPLTRRVLRCLDRIVCQYEDTAERFRSLGAAAVEVTGSVKFDAELSPGPFSFSDPGFGDAPVWIAGSTHPGEEEIILGAHLRLLDKHSDLRLIVAPRHPERAPGVARLFADRGMSVGLLSERARGAQVLIGDVMGTLAHLYGFADVAFVGGSLDDTGGHNPIEAAAHGMPVIMGPARFKIEEICARFEAAGCFHPIAGADDLARVVGQLLADPDRRVREGRWARVVVERNRGARQALVDRLCEWLSEASGA